MDLDNLPIVVPRSERVVKARESIIKQQLNDWADTIINDFGSVFTGTASFNKPIIIVSDEVKTSHSGDLDRAEIGRHLERLRKEFFERSYDKSDGDRVASGLTNQDCSKNWLEELKHEYPHLSDKLRKLYDDVKRLWFREYIEFTTFGEYFSSTNTIVIYYNAIKHEVETISNAAFLNRMRLCLAHEMMHALHFQNANTTYKESSYYAFVVKEALADFYAYVFGLNDLQTNADGLIPKDSQQASYNLYDSWERHKYNNYPYANARFFMYRNNNEYWDRTLSECAVEGDLAKMQLILDLSKTDMYKAYCELVPEDQRRFYENNVPELRGGHGAGGRITKGKLLVNDIGCTETELFFWEVLKQMIRTLDITSLEELQDCIGPDVIKIKRGRFITLESGEILSAYPQWEIIDIDEFFRISNQLGIVLFPFGSEAIKNKWNAVRAGEKTYTIISVKFSRGYDDYAYLGNLAHYPDIKTGDRVLVRAKGLIKTATVTSICEQTEDEYQDILDSLGITELSEVIEVVE